MSQALMTVIYLAYLVAASLFIIGLKMLSSPLTARRGNQLAALGMFIAVVATLLVKEIVTYEWIIAGVLIGGAIGFIMAKTVKMTAMPEMVAAFNGFGGGASALVAGAEIARYIHLGTTPETATTLTIALSVLIGTVTFSGSFVAFGKLGGWITGKPVLFPGIRVVSILVALGILVSGGYALAHLEQFAVNPAAVVEAFFVLAILSFILGILLVIPIGGADMPVVVALLNSYSGLAAAATGFVLNNYVLIVSGALVGASGFILTRIMCEAMNRSMLNVLLGGFGGGGEEAVAAEAGEKTVRTVTPEDAAVMMAYANKVIIIPGYGMAVAQAQHAVRELADLLREKGVDVKFAIHPVAGRMPGHMNVLLAEANVPYELLKEMDEINPEFETTDVALVIGANDVVNPAAERDPNSPIYGMPILQAHKAKNVIVIKRSLRPGYAGIDNELFYLPNTSMLFGDAKEMVEKLISAIKELT